MMLKRKDTGYYGEEIARRVLEKQGYRLLEKNFTVRGGEIDLIMAKGAELVFVEVKTRRNDRFGSPLEAITHQKQKHMTFAANMFLEGRDPAQYDIRFFAAAVYLDSRDRIKKVEIYKDIFV